MIILSLACKRFNLIALKIIVQKRNAGIKWNKPSGKYGDGAQCENTD
jgi:hypothetical protein